MKTIDIILVLLMFTCAGLCIWCLWLDTRKEQLEGYIKRLEQEYGIEPEFTGED